MNFLTLDELSTMLSTLVDYKVHTYLVQTDDITLDTLIDTCPEIVFQMSSIPSNPNRIILTFQQIVPDIECVIDNMNGTYIMWKNNVDEYIKVHPNTLNVQPHYDEELCIVHKL